MPESPEELFLADIQHVQQIPIVNEMLEMICRTTGAGFAAVARVTDNRWIACATHDEIGFGLEAGGELQVESTICNEIRQNPQVVVFDNADEDPVYAGHHTPRIYGLKSYISVPLFEKNGNFFGTLCAIDPSPRRLNNPETIAMFRFYADLLAFHLQATARLERSEASLELSEASLAQERQTAELREQFIAILGHDLRNPVSAIQNAAQLLLRMPLEDRVKRLAVILRDTSLRVRGLIDNILDFARGRLGEGIVLERRLEDLEQPIRQIIAELELNRPERMIICDFQLESPVFVDSRRVMQLCGNLLSNALTHGDKQHPVRLSAQSNGAALIISIANAGVPIPEQLMANLFQPFSRGAIKPGQQGLGLGLFIASEIAKAHTGTLSVRSDETETCFTLHIPLNDIS